MDIKKREKKKNNLKVISIGNTIISERKRGLGKVSGSELSHA